MHLICMNCLAKASRQRAGSAEKECREMDSARRRWRQNRR
ncbi:hypothetical protein GCM10008922_48440 [Faecalicatena contorta]